MTQARRGQDAAATVEAPPFRRRRAASVTEDAVVAAALRLIETVGFQDLSMRALARELGVPTMTVYYYVPSKSALQQLVIDHILRDVRIPGPEEGTWEQRLRALERDARRVLTAHPGLGNLVGDSGSTEGTRLAQGVVDILRAGGFSPEASVLGFATLFTFMTGQINLDFIEGTLATTGSGTFESVTASSTLSRDELFEFGFDAVIEGLKIKLLQQAPVKRSRRAAQS